MSSIILANWPNTHWMNKEWAKEKREGVQKENIILMEHYFPNITKKQLASKMGIPVESYYQLRYKYKLTKRRGK